MRCKQSSEDTFDLKQSKDIVGYLEKVKIAPDGTVLSGRHRLLADPHWPTETVLDATTPFKKALYIWHYSLYRTISEDEKKANINWMLKMLSGQTHIDDPVLQDVLDKYRKEVSGHTVQKVLDGRPANDLLQCCATILGISYRTVLRYADSRYKQKTPSVKTIKPKNPSEHVDSSDNKPKKKEHKESKYPECQCRYCTHFKVCKEITT